MVQCSLLAQTPNTDTVHVYVHLAWLHAPVAKSLGVIFKLRIIQAAANSRGNRLWSKMFYPYVSKSVHQRFITTILLCRCLIGLHISVIWIFSVDVCLSRKCTEMMLSSPLDYQWSCDMCKVFDEGMGSVEFATPWLNNRILKRLNR